MPQPNGIPPSPIAATLSTGTAALVVTFDRLLQPGLSAAANWTGQGVVGIANKKFLVALPLTIAGATVTGTVTPFGALQFPPDFVDYLAAPPDVRALDGTPAAAFAAFPLASVP